MDRDDTLRHVPRIVWRHRGKVALWCVLCGLATVAVTMLTEPRFRSEGKIFVRLGRENAALDPTATPGQATVVAIPHSREEEINSVVEVLRSRALAEALVDSIGAAAILGERPAAGAKESSTSTVDAGLNEQDPVPRPWYRRLESNGPATLRDRALEVFAKRLTVEAPRKSNVISITYEGPGPRLARRVVAGLIETYGARHVALNRTQGARDFFAEQSTAASARLEQSEQELRDLKNESATVSLPDQRRVLVERLGRLEDESLKAESDLAAAEAELASATELLVTLPKTRVSEREEGLPNAAADGMRQQLYALEFKEQELLTRYPESSFQVQQVRQQAREARRILEGEDASREQTTTTPSRDYEELHLTSLMRRTTVALLSAKSKTLRSQLADTRSGLNGLNENEMRLARAERRLAIDDTRYRAYAQGHEQARIDQALELARISNISLVQPATFQARPVAPRKVQYALLGMAAAALGGVALALVAESQERADPWQALEERHIDEVEARVMSPAISRIRQEPVVGHVHGDRVSNGDLASNGDHA